MVLPFALLLLLIAAAPIAVPHFWEKYYPVISVGLGLITVGYYGMVLRHGAPLMHTVIEYVSFMSLITALFVVSGGIFIRIKGEATPGVNVLFLFVGAVLANLVGTTGASMLLIRPWIRMNKYRVTQFHVVFFIFIVSNVGGLLTPIGDPPLFLGFLKGVPFWWMLQHAWVAWLIALALLLGCFYVLDRRNFLRADASIREKQTSEEHWKVTGIGNLAAVGAILVAVFLPLGWREAAMLLVAILSYRLTPTSVHEANHFDFAPIKEVAWLFVGIFTTMLPALEILEQNAGKLGLHSEIQFYWFTGFLSGVLDNAPTYLAFLATAFGIAGLNMDQDMADFVKQYPGTLLAISVAAVFFGALTYIGNGPNLMVKKIAEQQKVHVPTFAVYTVRYAFPILLPVLGLVAISFFSRWRLF